ncbi:MAG: nitronate monooxygenase family protein [Lachnospiraceae bacterium]|nr:nitronate monooxygenase family protein [Lachnospiraceae bacterium]
MEMLKIGKKTAKLPIIQGGMGVGISLGNLAGSVAAEGAVGIISSAQIGFREPDFDKQPQKANLRAIEKEMKKAREISPDGIIGFNIMTALRDFEDHARAAAAAGADLIISGAGLPVDLPAYVKDSDTCIAPIVSSDKSARVILKYWDKKYGRTADLVVIEGPKAGGHLGFKKEELEYYTDELYAQEIRKIIHTVKSYEEKYNCRIPVVVAGGIYSHEEVMHAFSLGADGVQVGTRFVTTEECDAHINYKKAYIRAQKEDIVIARSPVGMPGRTILNPFLKRVMLGEKIPHTPCHRCLAHCNPADIPYCITDGLVNAANGRIDDALLFCGAEVYRAEKIETVKEVLKSLIGQ